jgi:hypothetical protein
MSTEVVDDKSSSEQLMGVAPEAADTLGGKDDSGRDKEDEDALEKKSNASLGDRFYESWSTGLDHMNKATRKEFHDIKEELVDECYPSSLFEDDGSGGGGLGSKLYSLFLLLLGSFYVPHLPAFHRPGWLVKIAVGPYDVEWMDAFFADITAGLTVAMTLIPQGLSYATLANQPPINGL